MSHLLLASSQCYERAALAASIKTADHNVKITEVSTGAAFLEASTSDQYSGAILGELLDVGGLQLARFIRRRDRRLPVIVLTDVAALLGACCRDDNTFFVSRESPSATALLILRTLRTRRAHQVLFVGPKNGELLRLAEHLGERFAVDVADSAESAIQAWGRVEHELIIIRQCQEGMLFDSVMPQIYVMRPCQAAIVICDASDASRSMLFAGVDAVVSHDSCSAALNEMAECVIRQHACDAVARRDRMLSDQLHAISSHVVAAQYSLARGLTGSARKQLANAIANCESDLPSDDELCAITATADLEDVSLLQALQA